MRAFDARLDAWLDRLAGSRLRWHAVFGTSGLLIYFAVFLLAIK